MTAPAARRSLAVVLLGLVLALTAVAAPVRVAAVADPAATQAGVRVVDYGDDWPTVYRASGQLGRLHATSSSFRRFVAHRLDRLYRGTGPDRRCRRAALVSVGIWRSDGYAKGVEGFDQRGRCPDGGGAMALYRRHDGAWRHLWGGHEAPRCRLLVRHRVPRMMADWCLAGDEFVRYRGPRHRY